MYIDLQTPEHTPIMFALLRDMTFLQTFKPHGFKKKRITNMKNVSFYETLYVLDPISFGGATLH